MCLFVSRLNTDEFFLALAGRSPVLTSLKSHVFFQAWAKKKQKVCLNITDFIRLCFFSYFRYILKIACFSIINSGNSVTDDLIRHATPVLYPLYWTRLWTVFLLKWSSMEERNICCARVHFGWFLRTLFYPFVFHYFL